MIRNLTHVLNDSGGRTTLRADANNHLHVTDSKLPTALTGSGNLKVCIQELGNEGSERLNTDAIVAGMNGGLPSALTGSGNLKVCIQELGNEGSERLNTDAIVNGMRGGLPTALTGDGNLKVSIQEDHTHNLALASNQTANGEKLGTFIANQTNGAQKTLLVGSNDILGGTPHRHLTVEGNGRLLTIPHMPTTNNHLSALKSQIPTALSGNGNLKVSVEEGGGGLSHTVNDSYHSGALNSNASTASLDCSGAVAVRLHGDQNTQTIQLRIQGSVDGSNWYYVASLDNSTTMSMINEMIGATTFVHCYIQNPPKFIRVLNTDASNVNALTLHTSVTK